MKKLLAVLLVVAMCCSMLAACGSSGTGSTSAPTSKPTENTGSSQPDGTEAPTGETPAAAGTIKFGMSGPLTGGASAYGLAVKAGMEIAVEEINAMGGLQIEFRAEDDQADGAMAVDAYNTLKDWGMQIFAGNVTSGAANAVAPETVADNFVNMTPSASAESVALAGSTVFQMCFTDPNQGALAAELIADDESVTAIGVIYDSSDDYSSGLFKGFMAKAKELNLNVVAETSFTADNKADLTTQVTKCQEMGADLVFLPIYYSEAAQVLTSANKMGYTPKFFGCDGMDGILTVEGLDKSLCEGLTLMTPFDATSSDPRVQSFVSKFEAKMDGLTPNQFAADAYDVVYALYNAAVAAGVTGNESVDEITAAVVAQLNAMSMDGLTGSGMTWDANGMISKLPAVVVITDGVYVPVQ